MSPVTKTAHVGSFVTGLPAAIGARNGTIPSLAIDCSNLGAPVRDWRPAPQVDNKQPISITSLCGQTIWAVIKALLFDIDRPNLSRKTSPFQWLKNVSLRNWPTQRIKVGN